MDRKSISPQEACDKAVEIVYLHGALIPGFRPQDNHVGLNGSYASFRWTWGWGLEVSLQVSMDMTRSRSPVIRPVVTVGCSASEREVSAMSAYLDLLARVTAVGHVVQALLDQETIEVKE